MPNQPFLGNLVSGKVLHPNLHLEKSVAVIYVFLETELLGGWNERLSGLGIIWQSRKILEVY